MSFFNITISGFEQVESELNAIISDIRQNTKNALNYTGGELITMLQKHIREDWYDAYTPLHYERRTDGGHGIGFALGDINNMEATTLDTTLTLTYSPDSNQWIPPNWDVSGDGLIQIIQNASGYGWQNYSGDDTDDDTGGIPERPFWNNFVEELQNGGLINAFVQGFAPFYVVTANGDERVDLSESML